MAQNIFFRENEDIDLYEVKPVTAPVRGIVEVPGSKSVTNRALLMAALGKGTTVLEGVLFSDDSRHFLGSLESLGFCLKVEESAKQVTITGCNGTIPRKEATIDVGSAGTAARFLTAMLALSEGTYTILCSEQMKRRPMGPLFEALAQAGAEFEYLEEELHLPVRVKGNGSSFHHMEMDISKSTQFLSALLMIAPMTGNDVTIHIVSEKKDGAYIRITRHMMEAFGVHTEFDGNSYQIPAHQSYKMERYRVEPDVSAACYFYGAAALTGGEIIVGGVHEGLMQGDMKFLQVLEKMGCRIQDTQAGIQVTGPENGVYAGITADLNDFSDQALTLAALAAYATSETIIQNVAHIRLQECDRMEAIRSQLIQVGAGCMTDGTNITITPGTLHGADIETFEDHRVAMAMSLLGLRTPGIRIRNPQCCQKTFENYFEVLTELIK